MFKNIEIFCDALSIIGESPVWDERGRKLLYVDILGKYISSVDYFSGKVHHISLQQQVGSIVQAIDGRLLGCLEDGIYEICANGEIIPIFAPLKLDGDRFNDVKAGPDGCLYGGTYASMGLGQAAFYRIDKKGTMSKLIESVGNSNGIEWSHDLTKLYFNDTPTCKTFEYEFNIKEGSISNMKVIMDYTPFGGYPDGMTMDNEGMLWVALWGGAKVVRVDPKNRRVIREISLPVTNVTSCVFAGDDYQDLIITTSCYNTDLRKEKYAGAIFKIKTDVSGKPAYKFG